MLGESLNFSKPFKFQGAFPSLFFAQSPMVLLFLLHVKDA